jgi:hypothetical protein
MVRDSVRLLGLDTRGPSELQEDEIRRRDRGCPPEQGGRRVFIDGGAQPFDPATEEIALY